MCELPGVSIVTILHDWCEFSPLFQYHWDTLDYPKDKLEWIIVDDSKTNHSDKIPIHENILYISIDSEEYLDKITFKNDDHNIVKNYFKETGKLPNGFKRDYVVGLTSNEYIFHLDFDTLYNPNVIKRKLKYIREKNLDCIYCNEMLCYDIYNDKLYKTEQSFGYESTLFHTKESWKNNGFQWCDVKDECVNFYYQKSNNRKLDNYYDTIKLLSLHNLNKYQPKEVKLDNIKMEIPELIKEIKIDKYPIYYELQDLYYQKPVTVLSINSGLLDHLKNDLWNISEIKIDKKKKEKEIIKEIKEFDKTFDLCILNINYPVWRIFDKMKFNVILFENGKNIDQMDSILRSKGYLKIDNLYYLIEFLKSEEEEKEKEKEE